MLQNYRLYYHVVETNQYRLSSSFKHSKLPKQWDREENRTRVPNSLEQFKSVQTVFDKLYNVKAISCNFGEKTAKLLLELQAKWFLKYQNL